MVSPPTRRENLITTGYFYAHSLTGRPEGEWEGLEEHLQRVAALARDFASSFGAEDWGRLAGLWHDLGKYRPEFQNRLRGSRESVEHAGVGAALAFEKDKSRGLPLAFVIAGHHAGLTNLHSSLEAAGAPLRQRLTDNRRPLAEARPSIPESLAASDLPPKLAREDLASLEMWTRFLFSCLVDADYLATEGFYSPGLRASARQGQGEIPALRLRLDERLDRLVAGIPLERRDTEVNRRRAQVLAACRLAAGRAPGLFSLTVPTGGGKTLASMAFALDHAERHGMRRVIAAIPFTSIIEQNARVYREALGEANVVEHHSALDPVAAEERNPEAEIRRRLSAENWDAPVVVTTNVQLFESLFASSPSRCRKLHNLARSVILLDEAQALPVELLLPVLDAIRELVDHYGCTVVLSTATQPALARRESFPDGLERVHEIVPDGGDLFRSLERVEPAWPDPDGPARPYVELAREIAEQDQVLAVVHRRRDARVLAELLPVEGRFHLSALMCPAHRTNILDRVKAGLLKGDRVRLVSTQLIEAGVDVDFPLVYRALAGLDSLAQAAGRCNREGGLLPAKGRVVFFLAETEPPRGILTKGLATTLKLLRAQGSIDLSDPKVYEEYFRELYFHSDLDARQIQPQRRELNFATVSRRFQMITDSGQPVVVPYGKAHERLEALRRSGPDRLLLRSLQPFIVNISPRDVSLLQEAGALELVAETVHALIPAFTGLYHPDFGMTLDDEPQPDPERLVV